MISKQNSLSSEVLVEKYQMSLKLYFLMPAYEDFSLTD